ncbi:MAG: zinc ribbon domain-containing protein [Pseudomonadota bacterium]|nr:zinc ribbon domain-containing protein [Pseudomonadota bacterium]
MPLYDFECLRCQRQFEAFLKMRETPAALTCPECGAGNPRKLVTAFQTNAWSSFLDDMERRVNPQKFK